MSSKNLVQGSTEQKQSVEKATVTQAQVLVPSNLKIDLNSPTDIWVVGANGLVGLAGLVTAAVVAWITRLNQVSQNKINQASFRQKWQERFAEAAARYLSLVNDIAIDAVLETKDPKERKILVAKSLSDLLYWHEVIHVMLQRDRDYTKETVKIMQDLTGHLQRVELKELGISRNLLRRKFNEIHEKAWQDIRSDLEV